MTHWGILTFICVTFIFVEARRFHQKRETKSHLCDPVYNNTNKIQCYCIKDSREHELLVRSADCYPTVEGVPPEDPIWNSFEELKHVHKLSFTNTKGITLKYIPKNALRHTKALVKLEVKYGNIEIIEPFAFANLSEVKDITLTDNQIKVLKVNAFAHHRELVRIGLDTNGIIEINRDVFIDCPSLEKLYLTSNKITTIHDKAFVHLSNLRELEIDRNNIFSLNSETFSGLKKLEKLDLSGNSLEVIGDNTFLPLKNLRILNLEGNKIQMLDEKAFNGLVLMHSLSLAHNVLADIDNIKTFEGLKSLTLMSLKGNKLHALKPEVMAPILKNFYSNISSLDIEDNNFPCDCRLDWFLSIMNTTRSPHLKLSIENMKCIPDNDLRDKWMKAAESEKDEDDGDAPAGTDFEYYDDTELNGKLFYIDLRYLMNCSNNFDTVPTTPPNIVTTPMITYKPTTKRVIENTSKSNPSTHKPIDMSLATTHKVSNQGVLDLSIESTTVGIIKSNVQNHQNDIDSKEKKSNVYTTSRLATVSAKPIEKQEYNDQDMASDEAKPDQIKFHRSVQDIKDTEGYESNNANKNLGCVILLVIMLCIRFY